MNKVLLSMLLLPYVFVSSCVTGEKIVTGRRISRFEASLERLQRDLKIPGMAAVILEGREVVWAKGFGLADVEKGIEANPNTPFQLCSMTKPVAAMLLLGQVEEGRLDLDTPMSRYGLSYESDGVVRLRNLLTHTSHGVPGTRFQYHGDRYGTMGTAIRRDAGKSFRTLLIERLIEPLGMTDTAPNPADPEILERFTRYREENGSDTSIRNSDGEEWAYGELFDYSGPLYDSSINLAMTLLADYFDSVDIKKERFLRYGDRATDERTRKEFAEFYDETGRFLDIYSRLATPYVRDQEGEMVPGRYSMFFNCAAGLNSSVLDMAKFDIALDEGSIVSPEMRARAFEAVVTAAGDTLPYGLGWFHEEYKGVTLIWHGGEWRCASGLYLKIPDRELTLIVEANSRHLSQAFAMGLGSVLESGVGLEFLRIFVYGPDAGEQGPDVDWASMPDAAPGILSGIEDEDLLDLYKKEMQVMEGMYLFMGRGDVTSAIFEKVHMDVIPGCRNGPYDDIEPLAALEKVGDDADLTRDFSLPADSRVRVYAMGEISEQDEWDYGWIEESSTGRVVWKMRREETVEAGGADRNRLTDISIELPAGDYRLRYKSDEAHSYLSWYSSAPDHLYWGIRLHPEGGPATATDDR